MRHWLIKSLSGKPAPVREITDSASNWDFELLWFDSASVTGRLALVNAGRSSATLSI
jgi:hypothetical protein